MTEKKSCLYPDAESTQLDFSFLRGREGERERERRRKRTCRPLGSGDKGAVGTLIVMNTEPAISISHTPFQRSNSVKPEFVTCICK